MNMREVVVLVNEKDEVVGEMEKLAAHREGSLHRAISVFVFNSKGEMLLQQRAAGKYHGALLWSNACCSHPYPGESPLSAAERRLEEEMGFTTPLEFVFSFQYRAEVENGLTEHEFDHVFAGIYDGPIDPNANEVAAYEYRSLDKVKADITSHPEKYTQWLQIIFADVEKWWRKKYEVGSKKSEVGGKR